MNLGGLPAHRFDELMTYAQQERTPVVAVQETRRRDSACWQSGGYRVIHSGEGEGSGTKGCYSGVLLAVAGDTQLSYNELLPGRLLHVRLSCFPSMSASHSSSSMSLPLNIIVGYNKPTASSGCVDEADQSLEVRSCFWSRLDSLLASIPARQGILLLGDLNCHLLSHALHVAIGDPCGYESADAEELLSLLVRHDLRVHNLGRARRGITFQSSLSTTPVRGTRPDYIIMRHTMRARASPVKILWTLPMLTPSQAGWHGALAGTIDSRWRPWRNGIRNAVHKRACYDQHLLRAAQTPEHPMNVKFCNALRLSLSECHNTSAVDT